MVDGTVVHWYTACSLPPTTTARVFMFTVLAMVDGPVQGGPAILDINGLQPPKNNDESIEFSRGAVFGEVPCLETWRISEADSQESSLCPQPRVYAATRISIHCTMQVPLPGTEVLNFPIYYT